MLRRLDAFAEAQGLERTRVLSATIYVTDMAEKPAMNHVWQAFFEPGVVPAGEGTIEIVPSPATPLWRSEPASSRLAHLGRPPWPRAR